MLRFVCLCAGAMLSAGWAFANTPPETPTFTEPGSDGQIVNPGDVQMVTTAFSDPDSGDMHLCTDWEIWTASSPERVWQAGCVGGAALTHIYLGDGVFVGSYAGRTQLEYETDYTLRARYRDSSGDAGTEWSGWGTRSIRTAAQTQIFPLRIDDVANTPAPMLNMPGGTVFVLPADSTPPSISLETASGQLLLRFEGLDGFSNFVTNPPPVTVHEAVRVHVSAGGLSESLVLPETNLTIATDDGLLVTMYLPSALVAPGADEYYWVAESGATYAAEASQTEPDFSTLLRGGPVPFVSRVPGYVVEAVGSGYKLPVNIAFVPNPGPNPEDPFYYVTELYGTIKVVTNSGNVYDYATDLLNFNPTGFFPGSGEQGLTGIVVDPDTGDVFASYLHDYSGPHYPRVSRFHSSDGGLTASSEIVMLDMIGEWQGQSHQISNLSIGPDGKLYIHMGDGFDASTAQNLNSYRGKVLRLNRNGTIPTDNPFYNPADGYNSRDYVFAYGVRNPFGGAWRASNGKHYNVENGPSVDRFTRIEAGVNYLWDGSDGSMTNYAIYNWSPAHAPTNILFPDPSVQNAGGFPENMWDLAIVAESGPTYATGPQSLGKRIVMFEVDANDNLLSGPTTFIEYVGSGKASVVGLAMGPDGLYFTDLYKDQNYTSPIDRGANILRVRFVGDADFDADQTIGPAPLMVQFTDLSTVPNPTAWHWEFGDGSSSVLENPSHTYEIDGIYDVRLTVTGDSGLRVSSKPGFIRVGEPVHVGMIVGSIPPSAADQAIINHLSGEGFLVTPYDDDRANRPDAATIGAASDVVIVSSTISSSNVAGDFNTVAVPVIFWENALLSQTRMPLADSGGTVPSTTSISIVNNTHPITEDEALGTLQVYSSGATMSIARAPYGSGVQLLATRAGAPADGAILVAEQGALLLNGQTAADRRVYFFLEDSGWLTATSDAQQLFDKAVCWAARLQPPTIDASPASVSAAPGDTVQFTVSASGTSPLSYTWRRNGTAIPNAGSPTLTLTNVDAEDAGSYDVVVSNPCGQAVSDAALLTIVDCPADLNGDSLLDFFDVQMFLNLYSSSDPRADFVADGQFNFFDVQAFLGAFAAGCP